MQDHVNPDGNGAPAPAAASLSDRVRSLRLPQPTAAEPSNRPWLPWALCAVLGLTTTLFAVMAFSRTETPGATKTGGTPTTHTPATPERTGTTEAGAVVLESKGYIIPVHQIQVSPKVSGMVVKLNIEEGKQVKKGDILAELETVDYEADRNQARGQLDANWHRFLELYIGSRPEEIQSARAELDEAIAQRDQYYKDWVRSTKLNTKALADRDFEQAEGAYKSADRRVARMKQAYELMLAGPRVEQVQKAWAEVEQASANLTKVQWRLDNCVVRAPISGTILTKKAEEGNIVNPIAFNISASLCEMADLSDLEVDLNIQERDVANVFKGQQCKIRPEAFPKREYAGVVSRLMPIADRAKGAVPVRVKVVVPRGEEGKYLKPEMSVLVSFFNNK